jgi:hypothetical protein
MAVLLEIDAASALHLSHRERSDRVAIRVRGCALSWDLRALTRRFAPTSPRRGEVFIVTAPNSTRGHA